MFTGLSGCRGLGRRVSVGVRTGRVVDWLVGRCKYEWWVD